MNLVHQYPRRLGGFALRILVPATGAARDRSVLFLLLMAGLAGGLAEVAWIGAWSAMTPLAAGDVLREIVATVFPALAGAAFAPMLGLGIHLGLSVLLGLAFGYLVWPPALRAFGRSGAGTVAIALLVGIWACNFLLLLPALNPAFVELMPMPVTLTSKVLFAVAMAATLQQGTARPRD